MLGNEAWLLVSSPSILKVLKGIEVSSSCKCVRAKMLICFKGLTLYFLG